MISFFSNIYFYHHFFWGSKSTHKNTKCHGTVAHPKKKYWRFLFVESDDEGDDKKIGSDQPDDSGKSNAKEKGADSD